MAVAATCLGVALTWYLVANNVPQGLSLPLTFGFLALVWILFKLRIVPTPRGYAHPSLGRPSALRDVLTAVGCFAAGLAWVALLARRSGDTEAGADLVFIPLILLAVLGGFFLVRGFLNGLR